MGAQQRVRYEEGVQDGDIGEAERHMADKMAIPLDNIHFSFSFPSSLHFALRQSESGPGSEIWNSLAGAKASRRIHLLT